MAALSRSHRRVLALSLLGLALFAITMLAIVPWIAGGITHSEAIRNLTTEIQAREAMAVRVPSLQARLANLKNNADAANRFLSGASVSAADMAFQTKVRAILAAAGVQVISVESLPPREQDTLQRISMRMVLRGNESTLRDLLLGIDESVPLLFVERLSVNATGPVRNAREATSHLTVNLELFGYWRPEA